MSQLTITKSLVEKELSIRRHKIGIAKNRAMRLEGQLHKTRNYIKRLEDEITMIESGNIEILRQT